MKGILYKKKKKTGTGRLLILAMAAALLLPAAVSASEAEAEEKPLTLELAGTAAENDFGFIRGEAELLLTLRTTEYDANALQFRLEKDGQESLTFTARELAGMTEEETARLGLSSWQCVTEAEKDEPEPEPSGEETPDPSPGQDPETQPGEEPPAEPEEAPVRTVVRITLVFSARPEDSGTYSLSARYLPLPEAPEAAVSFILDNVNTDLLLSETSAPGFGRGIYGSADLPSFHFSAKKEGGASTLRKITCTAVNPENGYRQVVFFREFLSGEEIRETEGSFTVNPFLFSSDKAEILAVAEDFAGNESSSKVCFAADTAAPAGTLYFDRSDAVNGQYFAGEKHAVITFTDPHFDPDTPVTVSAGTGEGYTLSGWSREGYTWRREIAFTGEGSFRLSVTGRDLAGNFSEPLQTEPFIIDRTPPEIAVSFTDVPGANVLFFNSPRCALVTVRESNFAPEEVQIRFSGDSEEPVSSDWQYTDEGVYLKKILMDKDGEYAFTVSCRDLAGNRAEERSVDPFILDMTPPEAAYSGLADGASYNRLEDPLVLLTDRYLVGYSAMLSLEKADGSAADFPKPAVFTSENGRAVCLLQFLEALPDSRYFLTASASDMAGNTGSGRIGFTLNRAGSRYVRGAFPAAENLPVSSLSPFLRLTEVNLDPVTDRTILCIREGRTRMLKENEDYTVTEEEMSEGYCFHYDFRPAVFDRDGAYRLIVSSRDAAGNLNTNAFSAPVAFTLDSEAPGLQVSGLENGTGKKGDFLEYRLAFSDRFGLSRLTVEEDGEQVRCYVNQNGALVNINDPSDRLSPLEGSLNLVLFSRPLYRKVAFTARDLAGNTTRLVFDDILVYKGNPDRVKKETPPEGEESPAAAGSGCGYAVPFISYGRYR